MVNALRHSGAKRVELELEYSDSELLMRIHDNGCGIDLHLLEKGRDRHWGIAGRRERAARLRGLVRILSGPTTGTEVQLSIPRSIAFALSAHHHGLEYDRQYTGRLALTCGTINWSGRSPVQQLRR